MIPKTRFIRLKQKPSQQQLKQEDSILSILQEMNQTDSRSHNNSLDSNNHFCSHQPQYKSMITRPQINPLTPESSVIMLKVFSIGQQKYMVVVSQVVNSQSQMSLYVKNPYAEFEKKRTYPLEKQRITSCVLHGDDLYCGSESGKIAIYFNPCGADTHPISMNLNKQQGKFQILGITVHNSKINVLATENYLVNQWDYFVYLFATKDKATFTAFEKEQVQPGVTMVSEVVSDKVSQQTPRVCVLIDKVDSPRLYMSFSHMLDDIKQNKTKLVFQESHNRQLLEKRGKLKSLESNSKTVVGCTEYGVVLIWRVCPKTTAQGIWRCEMHFMFVLGLNQNYRGLYLKSSKIQNEVIVVGKRKTQTVGVDSKTSNEDQIGPISDSYTKVSSSGQISVLWGHLPSSYIKKVQATIECVSVGLFKLC